MNSVEQKVYRVYPSVVAPVVLSGAAIYLGVTRDYWLLSAIPFIILGSLCAAPNLNLADGFLVIVALLLGLAITLWISKPAGEAIMAGSFAGWILAGIEKRIRMRPM